jgi:hypothetical protein
MDFANTGLADCPFCRAPLRIDVFAALFEEPDKGRPAERIVVEDESSCFYHPRKKAERPCDVCGRFVCALCDVVIAGRHLCPPCLDAAKKREEEDRFVNQRVQYDNIALALAVAPVLLLFCWPASIVTAPLAIFLCMRYWKTPTSIFPRSKWRMIVALLLAGVQCLMWIGFVGMAVGIGRSGYIA